MPRLPAPAYFTLALALAAVFIHAAAGADVCNPFGLGAVAMCAGCPRYDGVCSVVVDARWGVPAVDGAATDDCTSSAAATSRHHSRPAQPHAHRATSNDAASDAQRANADPDRPKPRVWGRRASTAAVVGSAVVAAAACVALIGATVWRRRRLRGVEAVASPAMTPLANAAAGARAFR